MEEGGSDANAEVQTGTDRNGAETDLGGRGEWEVDAAGDWAEILYQVMCGDRVSNLSGRTL